MLISIFKYKTKSILFAGQHKYQEYKELNIMYKDGEIKQHSQVIYPGCVVGETISEESMDLKVTNKTTGKLKVLFREILS